MLHVAHYAKKTPIPRTKTELPNAHHVRLAVPPKKAALNVPIARRANLKMMSMGLKCAPNAPVGMHNVKQTNHSVLYVQREKKHQQVLPVLVQNVIWANSI